MSRFFWIERFFYVDRLSVDVVQLTEGEPDGVYVGRPLIFN